jgi:hypothetical protein
MVDNLNKYKIVLDLLKEQIVSIIATRNQQFRLMNHCSYLGWLLFSSNIRKATPQKTDKLKTNYKRHNGLGPSPTTWEVFFIHINCYNRTILLMLPIASTFVLSQAMAKYFPPQAFPNQESVSDSRLVFVSCFLFLCVPSTPYHPSFYFY